MGVYKGEKKIENILYGTIPLNNSHILKDGSHIVSCDIITIENIADNVNKEFKIENINIEQLTGISNIKYWSQISYYANKLENGIWDSTKNLYKYYLTTSYNYSTSSSSSTQHKFSFYAKGKQYSSQGQMAASGGWIPRAFSGNVDKSLMDPNNSGYSSLDKLYHKDIIATNVVSGNGWTDIDGATFKIKWFSKVQPYLVSITFGVTLKVTGLGPNKTFSI